MSEQRIRTEVIRVRVTVEEKEQFSSLCDSKAINQSELLRRLIKQWVAEQLDSEHKKK